MRKNLLIFAAGIVLGTAAGFAAAIFVYPFLFLDDIVAAEKLEAGTERPVVARGSFIHANPRDPIHYGSGAVTVYRDLVRLEADFRVGPGPKYHVYLVPQRGITPRTAVPKTRYVDLGRLKAFSGSQNYPVPANVDPAAYESVVIWCEQFGVLISPAELSRPSP
jgi:hypothetical protein